MLKRYSLSFAAFLFISDMALVVAALLIATWLRDILPFGKISENFDLPLPVYFIAVAIWGVVFLYLRVYRPSQTYRIGRELSHITVASAVSWFLFIGALYLSFRDASRLQAIYFGAVYVGLIWTHRAILRGFFRITGGRRFDSQRVLILGTGENAELIGETVNEHAWAGLYLVGFVQAEEEAPRSSLLDRPVLGHIKDSPGLIEQHQINEVIVALSARKQAELSDLILQLHELPVNIRIVPDYFDMVFLRSDIENFGATPIITLKEPSLSPSQRLAKRIFDVVLTSLLLIPLLPVMGLAAILIKLDSPGPVIFRQERFGEGGRLFQMLKFRTMVVDADQRWQEVAQQDEEGRLVHKIKDDPRVTRIGRILRRFSIDEFPQFFNILRGEMSLVGPRPELPRLVELYEPWQRKRFEVPQGLTGWWQVTGRADRPMHLNTDADLYYIRNYSIWLDLQIVLQTIIVALVGRGAY